MKKKQIQSKRNNGFFEYKSVNVFSCACADALTSFQGVWLAKFTATPSCLTILNPVSWCVALHHKSHPTTALMGTQDLTENSLGRGQAKGRKKKKKIYSGTSASGVSKRKSYKAVLGLH